MNEPTTCYQSYLVRFWQDSPSSGWRASARCVRTGELVHFADLDALFAFLRGQVVSQTPQPGEVAVRWREAPSFVNRSSKET